MQRVHDDKSPLSGFVETSSLPWRPSYELQPQQSALFFFFFNCKTVYMKILTSTKHPLALDILSCSQITILKKVQYFH